MSGRCSRNVSQSHSTPAWWEPPSLYRSSDLPPVVMVVWTGRRDPARGRVHTPCCLPSSRWLRLGSWWAVTPCAPGILPGPFFSCGLPQPAPHARSDTLGSECLSPGISLPALFFHNFRCLCSSTPSFWVFVSWLVILPTTCPVCTRPPG